MKKIYTAEITWISKKDGGRNSIPLKGTRYCPIIEIDASEKTHWSIDFICPDFSCTNIIKFSFISSDAPEDKIRINKEYALYEGRRKTGVVKVFKIFNNELDKQNDNNMNKTDFTELFKNQIKQLSLEDVDFYLHPVEEEKRYNSIDDFFRLAFSFPLNKLQYIKKNFDEVIKLFTWKKDIYPMWIDIYIKDEKTVHLFFSRRFRKYSEIKMKKDRDAAPFKLIDQQEMYKKYNESFHGK